MWDRGRMHEFSRIIFMVSNYGIFFFFFSYCSSFFYFYFYNLYHINNTDTTRKKGRIKRQKAHITMGWYILKQNGVREGWSA